MGDAVPRGGWSVREHGLAAHLRDAIRLNRARRPGYVRLGGRRSGLVSTLLIASERLLLPSAWGFDRQAQPFVQAGVPILVADLSPMPDPVPIVPARRRTRDAHLSSSEALGTSPASGEGKTLLSSDLRLGGVRWAVRRGNFSEAAERLVGALRTVRDAEAVEERAYALTAHVIESAGLMALRAPRYAEATGGATVRLSRRLVAGHLPLVAAALGLDRLAHPVQAHGVPLLVDDLPAIPFEAEHAAR